MSNQIKSASVTIKPADKRCRYWAKIVRADVELPLPAIADSANNVPGAYLRTGEDELYVGDILIEGEENHHRNNRGWSYWVTWCDAEGVARRVRNPGVDVKAALKTAGIAANLLAGSGQVAACIRLAHGIRSGLVDSIEYTTLG